MSDEEELAQKRHMYRGSMGPSWRWSLAVRMAGSPQSPLYELADDVVREAASFVCMFGGEDDDAMRAAQRYPRVDEAKQLWDRPETNQQLVILALADCPRARIATRFGVPEAVVATAELLFFDVRESLDATTWIIGSVIQPTLRAGNLSLATKYRAALYGGPVVAEALLDAEHRIPLNGVQRLADQEMLLHAKLLQAIEVPLDNSDSAQKFLKIQFDYQYRKQRLDLLREQFRHRCEQELRRHRLAEQRLQSRQAREEREARRDAKKSAQRTVSESRAEFDCQQRKARRAAEMAVAQRRAQQSPLAALKWPTPTKGKSHTTMAARGAAA